ncbi:hypothetical protein [Candidatus Nanohalococcus occultus]|uniref:Uncharacterized protein n=1 Tax=Candidatus Nanohalococcus occultus TaxID=2978047 RepID=A0ABY8CHN6_9ARCH|nr:hypothetical protein SVXNc_0495 [Candidatus Nanohaloarchaeota archaeon SVXNc]
MDADEIDPFLDEIIEQKLKEKSDDEVAEMLANKNNLSKGAKRVLMYLKNLDGEAEMDDLRIVLKAAPIMDEDRLDSILEELEEADKVEKTGSKVKLK